MRTSLALALGLVSLATIGLAHGATPGWGKRSQIGQLTKSLAAQKSPAFLGAIPGVRRLPLPAMGLPLLTDDPDANAKLATHGASEDLRGRPQAFRAALPDIGEIVHMIDETGAPEGRGYVIRAENDHLASTALMLDAVKKMGDGVKLDLVPGKDHVMEESAGEQRRILDAAKHVGAK